MATPAPGPNLIAIFRQDYDLTFDLTNNRLPLPPSTTNDVWLCIGLGGANCLSLSTVLLRKRLTVPGEVTVVDDPAGRITFHVTSADLSPAGAISAPGVYYYDVWLDYAGREQPMTRPAPISVQPGVGP